MLIDQGLVVRRNGSAAAQASGRGSPSRPRSTLCSLPASTGSRRGRAVLERGSVEGKVFHRGAVLALLAGARPRAARRPAASALAAGADPAGPSRLRR